MPYIFILNGQSALAEAYITQIVLLQNHTSIYEVNFHIHWNGQSALAAVDHLAWRKCCAVVKGM